MTLALNDPWPYEVAGMAVPYLAVGGTRVAPGQYAVPYAALISVLLWGNTLYAIG